METNNGMYDIVTLDELIPGDKAIIVISNRPRIVTVHEVDLDDKSFTIVEGGVNVSLYHVAILCNEKY